MTIHRHQIAIALVVPLAACVSLAFGGVDRDGGNDHSAALERPFGHAPTAMPPILPRVSAASLARAEDAQKQVPVSGAPDAHESFDPATTYDYGTNP